MSLPDVPSFEPIAPPVAAAPPIHRAPADDLPEDVLRYLNRLPRHNRTRRLADALINHQPLPAADLQEVVRSLSAPTNRGWRENLVAVWAASRSATEADRYSAAGWLSHVLEFWPSQDSWPRLKRSYQRTAIVMFVMLAISAGLGPETFFGPIFGAIPLCLFAYPFSAWLDRSRLNRIRAEAARGLGILGVPHSAGTLAYATQDGYENVRTASRNSLLRVLPTVTDDQYGRLPLETTPRLCALLGRNDEAIVLLTLRALRAVGDSRALEPVLRFINRMQGQWMNPEIPMEAQRTFEVLDARRRREIDAASLLRATGNPDEPEQSLLRAYVHAGDHAPENLLRATENE